MRENHYFFKLNRDFDSLLSEKSVDIYMRYKSFRLLVGSVLREANEH